MIPARDADIFQHLIIDFPRQLMSISLASNAWAFWPMPVPSGHLRTSLCGKLLQQCLCVLRHRRVEPFGEPMVERCEEITGFGALPLVALRAGERSRAARITKLIYVVQLLIHFVAHYPEATQGVAWRPSVRQTILGEAFLFPIHRIG